MSYNRNFLQSVFITAIVVACCDNALAAPSGGSTFALSVATDTNLQTTRSLTQPAREEDYFQTYKICNEGFYVSSCSNYTIGFNWLKSAKLSQLDGEDVTNVTTRDYYIGDTTLQLYEQLRTFFGHNGNISIRYKKDDGTIDSASPENLIEDRELILNSLCHPRIVTPVCAKCPNGAKVEESTVDVDTNNIAIRGSWKVYTIADCYMTEFEDSTGSYFYVPETVYTDEAVALTTLPDAAKCYYTNTNPGALEALNGDAIGTFVLGLNASQTDNDAQSRIPASDTRLFSSH